MKSTIFSIAFALAITAVSAQVPPCIESCAAPFIADTGCDGTDMSCLCGDRDFIMAVGPCISKCSPQDQQAAENLCSPPPTTSPTLSTRPSSVIHTTTASPTSGSANTATIPACPNSCIYSVILGTLSKCTGNDFKCMCESANFLTQLVECPATNCAKADEKATVAKIAAACGAAISPVPTSTTAINPVGNATIPINTGVHNSTAIHASTATSNFTRTSTTTSATDSSSSSESETSTNTEASSTSDPSPSPSEGSADRLVGSGLVAAVIGMAFFAL